MPKNCRLPPFSLQVHSVGCFDDFEWVPTRGMAIHDHTLGVTKLTYPDGLEGRGFFNRAFVLALRGFARKEPT